MCYGTDFGVLQVDMKERRLLRFSNGDKNKKEQIFLGGCRGRSSGPDILGGLGQTARLGGISGAKISGRDGRAVYGGHLRRRYSGGNIAIIY